MTSLALPTSQSGIVPARVLYPVTVFASAALVFIVEPLMGRLTLPLLGGGPSVWNASLAFFQIALLLGYLYAHVLQRVRSVRDQTLIHLGVLALAGAFLPLRLSALLGEPPAGAPARWLLAELALSVGAPFAVLSATAPLLQAWRARWSEDATVYGLYAASNLGSLIALVAYPIVIEPSLTLADQRLLWTVGYGVFFALAAAVALASRHDTGALVRPATATLRAALPHVWRERVVWVLLAAAPSSLMMGATTHLSSDVGSAPLLWVVPLGLYLLTFILAFRDGGERGGRTTSNLQALAVLGCTAALPMPPWAWRRSWGSICQPLPERPGLSSSALSPTSRSFETDRILPADLGRRTGRRGLQRLPSACDLQPGLGVPPGSRARLPRAADDE